MHKFKRFGIFTLASASPMLESSKEKAALWAAGPLVVGFSCEVEAQSRDFAVALDEELAQAKRDEGFVNLDYVLIITACAKVSAGGAEIWGCPDSSRGDDGIDSDAPHCILSPLGQTVYPFVQPALRPSWLRIPPR